MKIFRAAQVREIDNYTIQNEPVRPNDLMERAATRLAGWYVRHFQIDRRALFFIGPGNNGGDGLAMARMLADRQYRIRCIILGFGKKSADWLVNRKRLDDQGIAEIIELTEGDTMPAIEPSEVVVDGIFGSGLTRRAEGFPATVIRHINDYRNFNKDPFHE